MIFLLATICLIFFVILLFASPSLSPVPYFPTNGKDLALIIKTLKLKNDLTVFDLGAGDGVVIFEAAKSALRKKLNTRFIAVEINPLLVLILHVRRLINPNRKNIHIVWSDFFKMDFKSQAGINQSQIVFYLYISPWLLQKTLSNVRKQFVHFNLVSYMYPVRSLEKRKKIVKGLKHDIFYYFFM